jgi:hypothetical protein
MKRKTIYYVWKRCPDGLISATAGRMPSGWTQPNDNVVVSFEELGRFTHWYGKDGAAEFLDKKIGSVA